MTTDLVRRETLTALIGTYKLAVEEIEQGYALLYAAQNRLREAFTLGPSYFFKVLDSYNDHPGKDLTDKTLANIKKDAWRCIVDRLEIRRILSIARREELDRQLEGEKRSYDDVVKPLPDITEENVLAMFQEGMAKASDYANEAVFEVFDWLRPRGGQNATLKTNEKWKLGNKAIRYCVEMQFGGGYRVRFHHQANVTALDNVFHMLDGKGALKTHTGPLSDAIDKSGPEGVGETDYFKFKCCKNGNLHIEFKRPDLVAKINKTAGGRAIGN